MRKKIYFYFLAFFLICPKLSFAETVNRIVATVNQEIITQYELDNALANINKELARLPDEKRKNLAAQDIKRQALDHLIDETLLNQEIAKQKIQVTDAEIDTAIGNILKRNNLTREALQKELSSKGTSLESYRQDIRGQLVRMRFIQQVVGSKVKVNEEDVEGYYQQNFAKLQPDGDVHIAQIVLPLPEKPSDAEIKAAREKADEIYKKAKSGAKFEDLMQQYGGPGTGDLGKVKFSGLSPQLSLVLQNVEEGNLAEPVRTSAGFLVVKLVDKPEGMASLKGSEQVKSDIRDRIFEVKMQEEIKSYVDQLKSKAFVEIKS